METKLIENLDDVKLLVNDFYGKVREDDLLKDIFNEVIQDNWPTHLEKMYSFWQTILLRERTYNGAPFLHHANLPVEEEHFIRWLTLFHETLDNFFHGENADVAKFQSTQMARMFHTKIQYYRKNATKPLI